MIARSAGSRVKVYHRENRTPIEAKIPKSAMGATPAKEKEARPAAVVSEVMTMARPEWEKA